MKMADSNNEDSLTQLNTQLNKSIALMEYDVENVSQSNKKNKSIRISTKAQSNTSSKTPRSTVRKSILKKSEKISDVNENNIEENTEKANDENTEVNNRLSLQLSTIERPHNLQDLIEEETLVPESTPSTFNLDELSDSEDIWVMDIPRTINPKELLGQTLILGDKSKFKVGDERYCAVNHDNKYNVTCVFNTGKVKSRYKTVNIKSPGSITVRRKLSGIPKIKPLKTENSGVPFPDNLKTRHPLFGIHYEGNIKSTTKQMARV